MAPTTAGGSQQYRTIVDSDTPVTMLDPANFVHSGGANIDEAICSEEYLALMIPIHHQPHSWPGNGVIQLRVGELVQVEGEPPGVQASPRIMSDDKLRVQLNLKDADGNWAEVTQRGSTPNAYITATLEDVAHDGKKSRMYLFRELRFKKPGDYTMEITVGAGVKRGVSHHLLSIKRKIEVQSKDEYFSLLEKKEAESKLGTGS